MQNSSSFLAFCKTAVVILIRFLPLQNYKFVSIVVSAD